jgi:uncharacterized protein YciI
MNSQWLLLRISCILVLFLFANPLGAQGENPDYDPTLAAQLGADDYGMRSYTLVLLRTGQRSTDDKDFVNRCFRGHMENMTRMVDAGKLIVAGPIGKNEKSYRGIFILTETDPEAVKALLQTDPAIRENLLEAETYPWYGSAALPVYLDASKKIVKKKP